MTDEDDKEDMTKTLTEGYIKIKSAIETLRQCLDEDQENGVLWVKSQKAAELKKLLLEAEKLMDDDSKVTA